MISCFAIFTSLLPWAAPSAFPPQFTRLTHKVKPSRGRSALFKACAIAGMLVLLAPGCVRQQAAQSAELATYHQGSLRLPDNPNAPKLIYVDCRDGSSLAPHLNDHLERELRSGKFRLAASPSEAGYILHVNILEHGKVAPESLKAAVNAGYGGKTAFSGSGAAGLLVDALMVQRRAPEDKRPSRQKMKSISARNALDSSQMRMGILAQGRERSHEEFSRAIARELALRVEK